MAAGERTLKKVTRQAIEIRSRLAVVRLSPNVTLCRPFLPIGSYSSYRRFSGKLYYLYDLSGLNRRPGRHSYDSGCNPSWRIPRDGSTRREMTSMSVFRRSDGCRESPPNFPGYYGSDCNSLNNALRARCGKPNNRPTRCACKSPLSSSIGCDRRRN